MVLQRIVLQRSLRGSENHSALAYGRVSHRAALAQPSALWTTGPTLTLSLHSLLYVIVYFIAERLGFVNHGNFNGNLIGLEVLCVEGALFKSSYRKNPIPS